MVHRGRVDLRDVNGDFSARLRYRLGVERQFTVGSTALVPYAQAELFFDTRYDALSREFGGRPLYAVYGRDGGRYGYAWADQRPVIRRGEPEQGFVTAPARIPV